MGPFLKWEGLGSIDEPISQKQRVLKVSKVTVFYISDLNLPWQLYSFRLTQRTKFQVKGVDIILDF